MPSRDILQRVVENTTCSNVFICNQGSLDYIPLSGLCDGTEDCGEERSVCHASRSTTPMFVSALVFRDTRHLSYCLPGLGSMRADHDLRCKTQDFLTPDYPVFGTTIATISLPSNKIDCKYAYGELYVFLSCTGRCKDSPCPLTSIKHTKCENNPRTAMSLARSQYLTPVLREKLAYHNRLFQCDNRNCIGYDAVCNLVDDCGDGSDERMCTNSYKCTSKNHYISLTQKCDGKMDCMDYSDECNDECNKEIIEGVVFKALAWIIGGTAVFMNVITLWKGIFHPWIENKVGMTNRGFKVLISIGDFLTGIYLLLLAIVDFSLKNGKYCRAQLKWLTSDGCATLGLINNIGTNLSLFSMTYLSIFRVLNVLVWQVESKFLLLKMGTIVTLIVVCSTTIACFPLGSAFEDFFVNGIAYSDMSLFIGPADKARHQAVLRAYFGKISQRDMTWSRITNLLSLMFTNDYGEIKSRRIHFYGNEGVCLFKYFVRSNDPQNMYVWAILVINFVCFLTMSGCYLVLNTKVKRSGRGLRQMMAHSGNNMESTLDKRTEKLQHSITRIIVTDFVCWIPFLVICVLHSTWLIDATFLYSVSSIVILPINSIINPLIYDDFMVSWLSRLKDRILMTKSRVERKQGAPEIQIVLSKISTEYNNAPA